MLPHKIIQNKLLRETIDTKNKNALQVFLEQNPDIDLNSITPNGLSALWWALVPKKEEWPSREIVKTLLDTGRIDPTQRYCNQSISCFLEDAEKNEEWFEGGQVVCDFFYYEAQYYRIETEASWEEPDLVQFVNNSQNTHASTVVKAVDEAISALYQRYVNWEVEDTLSWDNQFSRWVDSDPVRNVLSSEEYTAAKHAITNIQKNGILREYVLLPSKNSITLSNAQVLMLLWRALNDKDCSHFMPGADMSESELFARQLRLLKHLSMAQNEYGQDIHACWMGMRNQMVSCLDATHVDVQISYELPLTNTQVIQKHAVLCNKRLQHLEVSNPNLFWEYVYFYLLRDFPGGCSAEIPPSLAIQNWVANVQKDFRVFIKQENGQYKVALQIPVDRLENLVVNLINPDENLWPALNHSLNSVLFRFERLLTLTQHAKMLKLLLNPTKLEEEVTCLIKFAHKNKQSLTVVNQSLTNYMVSQYHAEALLDWVRQEPDYALFLEPLDCERQSDWLQAYWPVLIEQFVQPDISNLRPQTTWLWQHLGKNLLSVLPVLSSWLGGLSCTVQQHFLYKIVVNKWHLSFDQNREEIYQWMCLVGIESGYFSGLVFEQPFFFDHKDLRGIDLSVIDLKYFYFNRCDLRLTGLLKNKTITTEHITTNRIEVDWLREAVCMGYIEAVKAFISSSFCTSACLLQKYGRNRRSAWQEALARRNWDIIKTILLSPHCTTEVLQQGIGHTVLHLVADIGDFEMLQNILASPSCTSVFFQKEYRVDGYTALHYGVESGEAKILQILINSPHCTTTMLKKKGQGYTALHLAVKYCRLDLVEILLASPYCTETVIRQKTEYEKLDTLHLALNRGNLEIIALLLAKLTPQAAQKKYYLALGKNASPLEGGRDLLKWYLYPAQRFFYPYWTRHHILEVTQIIEQIDTKKINSISQLLDKLESIQLVNPIGSLAHYVAFIKKECQVG